jgi:2-isopropylmalate synthase
LIDDSFGGSEQAWRLDCINLTTGTTTVPTATVRLRKGEDVLQDSPPGNGAVDATMKAINRILHQRRDLVDYHVS